MRVDIKNAISKAIPSALIATRIPWARISIIAIVFVLIALQMFNYYRKSFVGLTDRSSMDIAQVGRNIALGYGFTTHFVRPFNISIERTPLVNSMPELNNGPLPCYISAFFFKLKSPCDQLAIWASLLFALLSVLAAFWLGTILFSWQVGLLGASVLGLSAPVLHIGVSGNVWPLAAFLFTLLLVMIAYYHKSLISASRVAPALYAAAVAVCVALLYMTDYVLIVFVIPLTVYFATTRNRRRIDLVLFLIVTILLVTPCAYRNAVHTGFPVLGISGWNTMINTAEYPTDTLLRSTDVINRSPLKPLVFMVEHFPSCAKKLVTGVVRLVESLIPMIGLLALGFAVVSTLYRFRKPAENAVRGFVYGVIPLMLLTLSLYSSSVESVVMFAPVLAVYGSAYFLLLLDARKLHRFYARSLVGLFVFITAFHAISVQIWPPSVSEMLGDDSAAHQYFGKAGSEGVSALVYTDVPWMYAWRTLGIGIWLPRSDADVFSMSAKNLPLRYVILTPESNKYDPSEIWYQLHRVGLWRKYVENPKAAEQEMVAIIRASKEKVEPDRVNKYLRGLKRDFGVSETIAGLVLKLSFPLAPDDIQIYYSPSRVEE